MAMVIFFQTSVKSCGGGHVRSSREEGVWPSSSKKERVMTMFIFFHTSVESCGGGHGISSREEEVWASYSYEEEKDDHGHLPPFLSGEL